MNQVLNYVTGQGTWFSYFEKDIENDKFIQQGVIGLKGIRLKGEAKRNGVNKINLQKNTILACVKKNGAVLEYASKRLQDDKEVVLDAIRNNGFALLYASKRLKGDKEVVLAAVRNHGWALNCAVYKLRNDKEVVLAAIRNNPHALDGASYRLKNNKEIVNEAIKMSPLSLCHASTFLQSNKVFIKEQIKTNSHEVFKYCGITLREDKDIYLPVFKKDPSLCKLFSPKDLLKLDFSSLPKRNRKVIAENFEKRSREKDLFISAKAKKHILG